MTRAATRSLQAVVFDFDGVLADTEPLHLRLFQDTLAGRGIALTSADYYDRYLGFDDGDVFRAVARDRRLPWSEGDISAMVRHKSAGFRAEAATRPVLFPGVADRVRAWAASVPIAIASGAFRDEIEIVLDASGLRDLFPVIVGSGETPNGKPAPDPYLAALERLRQRQPGPAGESAADAPLPARSVAVEDSIWGVEAAHRAGMKVVAVTTGYPRERLASADAVVSSFDDLSLELFDALAGL